MTEGDCIKTIDYNLTKGSFTLKYLDDNEIVRGTINIDDNSIKTNLANYIIDNEEGSIFTYKSSPNSSVDILLVEKNIEMIYKEISEDSYYVFHHVDDDVFVNIKGINKLENNKIYFQFYYKPSEWKENGTPSNRIILGLKRYPMIDVYRPNGYYEEHNFFKNLFVKNFLIKFGLLHYDFDTICCVPSHIHAEKNNNSIALMIQDISKHTPFKDGSQYLIRKEDIKAQKEQGRRYKETHLNSISVNANVLDKKIILIDDITTSGSSLLACKEILLKKGAKEVICFAFGKSS